MPRQLTSPWSQLRWLGPFGLANIDRVSFTCQALRHLVQAATGGGRHSYGLEIDLGEGAYGQVIPGGISILWEHAQAVQTINKTPNWALARGLVLWKRGRGQVGLTP